MTDLSVDALDAPLAARAAADPRVRPHVLRGASGLARRVDGVPTLPPATV